MQTCIIRKDVDNIAQNALRTLDLPGLGLLVISRGRIEHMQAYGHRDLESQLPAMLETPFHISSLSKLIVNVLVFRLIEAGSLRLDSEINDYLPFAINGVKEPVTVRSLLSHRSGIRDDYENCYKRFWDVPNGDCELELEEFLREYLVSPGKYFSESNFAPYQEEVIYSYSNTGYALLGLVAEVVTGKSLRYLTSEFILAPLGMTNSGWFLSDFDNESDVAKPYVADNSVWKFRGHCGYPDYPSGQFRTSIADFSKFMLSILEVKEVAQILEPATIRQIVPNPETAHAGFYTWRIIALAGHLYYGHPGADVGTRAVVVCDFEAKSAVTAFTNCDVGLREFVKQIVTHDKGNA